MQGSISRKISLIILSVLSLSFIVVFVIMLIRSESTMTGEAEKNVKEVSTLINNSIVFAMNEGATSVTPFFEMLKSVPALKESRLIPANLIREDDSENRMDQQERRVFKNGQPVFIVEDFNDRKVLRAIRSINAIESCTECHSAAVGDPLAVLSLRYSIESIESAISTQRLSAFFGALFTVLIAFLAIRFFLEKQVLSRLKNFIEKITQLEQGDIRGEIDCSGNDELTRAGESLTMLQGALLDKVQVAEEIARGNLSKEIVDSASTAIRSEQDELSKSLNEMVQMLRTLFASISEDSTNMMNTSKQLNAISGTMSGEASALKDKSQTVTQASQEMNGNVESVTLSTAEMSATVNEIAGNTEKARQITADAVGLTKNTEQKISQLNSASAEINNVVEMIMDIAEQTKLLALNATIEAARAGEAGKGFAVVAGEVKDLAQQTNQATSEIRSKIEGIQNSTAEAVQQVGHINNIIGEIDDLVNMIATAVEEQNVTTRTIADNLNATAQLSDSVVQDMSKLNQAVDNVKQASDQTDQNATAVFSMGEALEKMVKKVHL